jgi:hypothetical protein
MADRDAGGTELISEPLAALGGQHVVLPAVEDLVELVLVRDVGDDVDRHLLVVVGRLGEVEAAEGIFPDVGRRLAQHVELARVLDVVELVADVVLIEPLGAQLEFGRLPTPRVGFVELIDIHAAAHYRRHAPTWAVDLGRRPGRRPGR